MNSELMKRSKSLSTPPPSDFTKPRPKRLPGEDWQDGLLRAMTDPEQIFDQDDLTVTLKDAFPKARYHYLIVPREQINSVKELSTKNLDLLNHMHKTAQDLISRVKKKEPVLYFRYGYHAVPSMKRLHMHVISQDFESPRMRTQHHWNTFNTEYFIDSSTVIDVLESEGQLMIDEEKYEALLTLPMKCNRCFKRYGDIFALKFHISQEHRSMLTSSQPAKSVYSAGIPKRRQSWMY